MKIIRNILAVAAIAAISAICSCKQQTPSTQFIDALDNAEAQISKATNIEEIMNMAVVLKESENVARNNQDYRLTDDDKEAIKKSMERLYRSAYAKDNELSGKNLPIEQIDMIVKMMEVSVDRAKSLADFVQVQNTEQSAEDPSSEVITE